MAFEASTTRLMFNLLSFPINARAKFPTPNMGGCCSNTQSEPSRLQFARGDVAGSPDAEDLALQQFVR